MIPNIQHPDKIPLVNLSVTTRQPPLNFKYTAISKNVVGRKAKSLQAKTSR